VYLSTLDSRKALGKRKKMSSETESYKGGPESSLEDVLEALCRIDQTPGSFCTGGEITDSTVHSYLFSELPTIEGVGAIPLPITEPFIENLKVVAEQAPHGSGTETIVDTCVRNTLQVDASKVSFEDDDDFLEDFISEFLEADLGLPQNLAQAKFYKLLLYEPGGHFAKHRDTEKIDGMFGTLVIQLPSVFKGGKSIVSHNGETQTYVQDETKAFHYVAHYADCEHEITPVESGYRLALVDSLYYKGSDTPPTVDAVRYNALASSIRRLPVKPWTKIL
jgi:hypothetical protein